MARRRGRIGDGLAGLAGAHPDVLKAAPGARARFVALGGVLLSTGGLAMFSAAFAVHMALGLWWPVAMLFGLGWGFVIVNLDRMLLVGMAHDASVRRNLLMAVPRIALALVLGVVIATPLTLQVFHREIDTEIVTLQAEASDAYKAKLDSDARFAHIPDLKKQIATEQASVASGGHDDAALTTVHAQLTTAQTAYDQALSQYQQLTAQAQCELNGTCGTGRAGEGTAYDSAKAAADAQGAVVTSAKAALDQATAAATAAEARSASEAGSNLKTDQEELASLTAQQKRLQAAFDATNANDSGILIRLQALGRLSDENATLGMAHTMLSLLFICIELLPVLMKTLLNFSPATAYERLAALRDESDVAVEEMAQQARRTVEQAKTDLLVMAEKDRVERQREEILARRRAFEARQARAALEPELDDVAEPARRMWDTGPILSAARNGLFRTLRTVAGRTPER
jgi:hypothetical protein